MVPMVSYFYPTFHSFFHPNFEFVGHHAECNVFAKLAKRMTNQTLLQTINSIAMNSTSSGRRRRRSVVLNHQDELEDMVNMISDRMVRALNRCYTNGG